MGKSELALMAHLMRRAGFGATRDELDTFAAQGYDATVEQLLHPGDSPIMEEEVLRILIPLLYSTRKRVKYKRMR